MKNNSVNKLKKALDLQRAIIGVKFLYTKEEFENTDIKVFQGKRQFCAMVKEGMEGNTYKYSKDNFGCRCGAESLGVVKELDNVISGERYYATKLHVSRSVAKKAQKSVLRISHLVYGIVVGPLETLDEADIVILMADTYQGMRIIQGYSYHFGVAENISMIGNQGVCSDLAAKPYENNDLNMSILCAGTRMANKWTKAEIGFGMPIDQFDTIVDGVIQTLNPIEYPPVKKEIKDRLDSPDELGIKIDPNEHYGKSAIAYTRVDGKIC